MHDNSFTKSSKKNKWKVNNNHHKQVRNNLDIQHGQQDNDSRLLDTPQEVLTYCTSFLDPQSLLSLGKTCRRLREHVADDNVWRRAFAYHFFSLSPETGLDDSTHGLMLRRNYKAWKREFISKHGLFRYVFTPLPV